MSLGVSIKDSCPEGDNQEQVNRKKTIRNKLSGKGPFMVTTSDTKKERKD